ncbi:MAG: UbiA family prenyltransferase [Methanomassiliicoccales archaeon]
MKAFFQVIRLGNCLMGVMALWLTLLIASGAELIDHITSAVAGSVVVFAFVAGGNALNDYLDRDIDRIAHPERPIPSGRMRPTTALRIAVACFTISIASSLFLNFWSIIIVVISVVVIVLYEARTKAMGLVGNASIAFLTASLFLLGGAMVEMVERTLAISAMAGLATLGREIVKDIQDMEGDFNRMTLPKRIGKRSAGLLGSAALLAAVVLSFQPYFMGIFGLEYLLTVLVADAIFIYSSLVHFRNPKRGQTWAKYGMLVALVAFLVGGIA